MPNTEQDKKTEKDSRISFRKIVAIGIVLGVTWVAFWLLTALLDSSKDKIVETIRNTPRNESVIYVVSWVILLIISLAAIAQIKEILISRSTDKLRRRADQIAIISGLVLVIFLFKQPYLDALFGGKTTNSWLSALLFTGGGISGWLVWYLRQLKRYGEFFHVFLMTEVVGLSWYARLTAPEQVQLSAVAFLLGSLFRIAKDYMDEAALQAPSIQRDKLPPESLSSGQ